MANKWYYTHGNQRHGPVSDAELRTLAAEGALSRDDLIWKEGMSEWKKAGSVNGLFTANDQPVPPVSMSARAEDEKYCEACGKAIKKEAFVCPHCGVKQKTAGIAGFFRKQLERFQAKIRAAKEAIATEMKTETGISPVVKAVAIIVAISAGWTGLTGLGSIIAGRYKAGFAMLGIPLLLGAITVLCLMATIISAIASLLVIGIPFFIIFGTLTMTFFPLFVTTFISFYVADVMICIKAK